jgi:hypothetical protein
MMGELATKNCGCEPNSSFRQIFFPLAASRHDSIPRTPSVTTFPSATAGEARGPENCAAGEFPSACTSYFSAQISFPVAASRHRVTSCPSCRENT